MRKKFIKKSKNILSTSIEKKKTTISTLAFKPANSPFIVTNPHMFSKTKIRNGNPLGIFLKPHKGFSQGQPKPFINPQALKKAHNTAFLVLTEPLIMSKLILASNLTLLSGAWAPIFAIPLGLYNLNTMSNIFQKRRDNPEESDITRDFKIFINFHSLMLSAGALSTPLFAAITNPVIIPSAVLIASTGWAAGRFCINLREKKTKGFLVALASGASSWTALKFLSYSMFVALGPNPFVSVLEYNTVWGLLGGISFYYGAVCSSARHSLKKGEKKSSVEIVLRFLFQLFENIKKGFFKGLGRG